ncbi:MAG: S1C family serine protease [Caldilineaceae bacterium]
MRGVEGGTLTAASWVEEAEITRRRVGCGRGPAAIRRRSGVGRPQRGGRRMAHRRRRAGDPLHQARSGDVPGFSGGALIGGSGVIGLLSSALVRDSGVALPAATVKPVVETLLAHGHMQRGYLGVGVQAVKLSAAQAEEFGQATGLLVTSVDDGSPAQTGGLLVVATSWPPSTGEAVRRPMIFLCCSSAARTRQWRCNSSAVGRRRR